MEFIAQRFPIANNVVLFRCCCILYRAIDNRICVQHYSTEPNLTEYKKYYKTLNIKADSDQETVRQAFLKLVKRFHPDSGSEEADAQKFQEIEIAYRKLQQKFHAERWSNESIGEYGLYYKEKRDNTETPVVQLDIKHTAPQHRQYLSYDGYGVGTPAQRHKQYQKMRANTAVENVYNHRITKIQEGETLNVEQALVVKDKKRAKDIKTRYGVDRLVEDLIQESMAKGEFDNLSGKGKPLSTRLDHHNPYVDLVTHKMNQVMIDNGFMPEWITLQKEIREDAQQLREKLASMRHSLPPLPLMADDADRWTTVVEGLRTDVQALNNKIGKYNLVVPLLHNQLLQFDLEKEANKVLNETPKITEEKPQPSKEKARMEEGSVIEQIISYMIKYKI